MKHGLRTGAEDAKRRGQVDYAITAAVSALDDEANLGAAMRSIELRHATGRSTSDDPTAYRSFWVALALRRSAGRGPYLSAVADEVLAEREWLESEIRTGQARVAIEAAFRRALEVEPSRPVHQ
ncbi:MAG: hypothetical protein ACRDTD_14265 [Pseudonocardiaceae bacterium]